MIYRGIDTAARITPQRAEILRQAGFSFVARYIVPTTGGTAWKALTAAEAANIRAAGLDLMLCWETSATRVKGGAVAGAEDAVTARSCAEALTVPAGTVIYMAADYDVQEGDLQAVEGYYRAARIACGKYVIGAYGGERVCRALAELGFSYLWQSYAWKSGDFLATAKVVQHEWQGGENALALKARLGVAVDLDRASSLDGMWHAPKPSSASDDALKWAQEARIIEGDSEEDRRIALALWRYHAYAWPEDPQPGGSGIIS